MKKILALFVFLAAMPALAQYSCPSRPTFCDSNGSKVSQITINSATPSSDCSSQTVTVTINATATTLTYGTDWTGATLLTACKSLATALVAGVTGVQNAVCTGSSGIINIYPNPNTVTYWSLASSTSACATAATTSKGTVQIGNTKIIDNGDGALQFVAASDGSTAATLTANTITALRPVSTFTSSHTASCTTEPQSIFYSATSGSVLTLPAAATGNKGCCFTFINNYASGQAIRVTPNSADGIGGSCVGGATVAQSQLPGTANKYVENTAATALLGDKITVCSTGSAGAKAWLVTDCSGIWLTAT